MGRSKVRLKPSVPQTGLRPHQWAKLLGIKPDTYVWIWRDPTVSKVIVSAPKDQQVVLEANPHWRYTEPDDFDETQLYFAMEEPA